jgi:Glycosyltransferase family 87
MKIPRKILLFLIGTSILLLAGYTIIKSPRLTHGFVSYYNHSKILVNGGDLTAAYDSTYFFARINEYGLGNTKDLANLPTGSFIFLPLTPFEPVTAKILWSVLSLVFLVTSIFVLLVSFDISVKSELSLLLTLVTLLFYPLYHNIALGQVYTFLLLLASIAVYGFKKDKSLLIAIPLSLMLLLKGYGVYPMLALLLSGRFKAFFITVAIAAGVFFAALPLFGISAWQMYYREFLSIIAFGRDASNVAYQSLNSFFGHLLIYHPDKNPHAIFNLSQVYIYYFVQLIGLITVYTLSKKFTRENYLFLFAVSFAVNVLVSPSGEDYHSLLYLPLIFLAAKHYLEKPFEFNFTTTLLVISVLLLAAPIPFRSLQPSDFPVYLLAYPRLYGAILLIIAAYFIPSAVISNEAKSKSISSRL